MTFSTDKVGSIRARTTEPSFVVTRLVGTKADLVPLEEGVGVGEDADETLVEAVVPFRPE
jgi:hypothetical protein